ncbi:MAG: DNA repair protein RecO [Mycoplasmatota bacterium]|nr:DNA repair protein RecO [Mycoplasmatota bacterium]
MKIDSFEGIILTETNYSESSKILNVLTNDRGVIGIMSKGCRNVKSKLRGVSRKLIYGTFHVYYKENGLSTLIGIDLINSFSKTMMDLERISFASYLLDLSYQVVRQNDDQDIFLLLRDTLLKIEEGLNPLVLSNILELKLLDYLGVRPSIDACSICGSEKAIVTLSADSGGYVCRNCFSNEGYVSEKTIKMIRLYYYVDIKNISKLEVSDDVSKEINQFLDMYYDRYTGLYLKSKDFIKKIGSMNQKAV